MTRIKSGTRTPAQKTVASAKKPSTTKGPAKATASKGAVGARAQDKIEFPRANWKDPVKLTGAINRAKQKLGLAEHPRGRYAKPDAGKPQPSKPPIVARYGVIRPDVPTPKPPIVARYGVIRPPPIDTEPPKPPIVARYGVIRPPVDSDPPKPPIVARYGVIRPDTDPPKPPIVARYGVIRPSPIDTEPPRAPAVARYGVVRPRPGVETEPRPGIKTGR
jgi:hypothetical protein